MANEIAERYSQGLYELAKENNTVSEKKDQAEGLITVLEENKDFLLFLKAVKITNENKKEAISTIFKDKLDIDMIHFLKLIVDKDRVYYLVAILERYVALANEYLGIEKAIVHSARKLSEEDMHRIQEALQKKTGKVIQLTNQIDPDLIAGIKVTVGNHVTDITMKSKIENMKEVLLKGGRA